MDELIDDLGGSFTISVIPNNTSAPHPRFSQYKARKTCSNQDERRQKFLELQKKKRFDFANHVRCLMDNAWDNIDVEKVEEEEDLMDVEKLQLPKPGRYYQNQLMLSEWMLEVPQNFVDDWVMVPCPVGKRNLVIASSGITKAFARNGRRVNSFPSAVPGGSRKSGRSGNTVLDCIYCEASQTYYVLDVMCWGHTLYDSETEFRFYWMQTKLQETPDACVLSKSNPYRFEVLPNYSCTHECLESVMTNAFNFELDGLLFYHKRTHYTFGPSPLVLWLKAYMLPEILGIRISESLARLAPSTYVDFGSHADVVRKRQLERASKQSEKVDRVNQLMDSETNTADAVEGSMCSESSDMTSVEQRQ